ncbi:MAG TPA: hypothetical protein VGQ29_06885 [Gemmatimonadales bacterium]|jgi:hypothetical protein|nr:hypothetical protein [Gemmatimonadales bacterium]
MKLQTAILADYVADFGGKMMICGTFDVIFSPNLPAVLPAGGLALRLEASHGEVGNHSITITLRDEDGKQVGPKLEGEMNIAPGRFVKNVAPTAQVALMFSGLQFARYGTYEFEVLVDGRHVGDVPLHVVQQQSAVRAA